jgi:hypothetical protein
VRRATTGLETSTFTLVPPKPLEVTPLQETELGNVSASDRIATSSPPLPVFKYGFITLKWQLGVGTPMTKLSMAFARPVIPAQWRV